MRIPPKERLGLVMKPAARTLAHARALGLGLVVLADQGQDREEVIVGHEGGPGLHSLTGGLVAGLRWRIRL